MSRLVNDFCVYLCVVILLPLFLVQDLLPAVGFDFVQISVLKETGKEFDEFFLFLRAATPPLRVFKPNNLGIFVVTAWECAPDGKLRDETR